MKKQTEEWLNSADDDLKVISKIIDSFKDEVYCILEAGIRYHHELVERIILEAGE